MQFSVIPTFLGGGSYSSAGYTVSIFWALSIENSSMKRIDDNSMSKNKQIKRQNKIIDSIFVLQQLKKEQQQKFFFMKVHMTYEKGWRMCHPKHCLNNKNKVFKLSKWFFEYKWLLKIIQWKVKDIAQSWKNCCMNLSKQVNITSKEPLLSPINIFVVNYQFFCYFSMLTKKPPSRSEILSFVKQ